MSTQPQMKIDIKTTTPIDLDGNIVFSEGVILRKASKFLAGTAEDAIIPIPCFYCVKTGKILVDLLPKEIREEYKDKTI